MSRKNLIPQQELNLRPSKHWSDAPTTELRRTHDFVIQYTRFMYDMLPTY